MTPTTADVQQSGVAAFSLTVLKAGDGYEYEVLNRAAGIGSADIADALFAIALDISAEVKRSSS